MSVLDERVHLAVIDALLNAALGPDPANNDGPRAFAYGTVPGEPGNPGVRPPIFVVRSLERRYVEPQVAGRAAVGSWRLTTRHVGRTVADAEWAAAQISAALNEARLTIGGAQTTPVTHESTSAVAPDDGMFSGVTNWTYALT